MEVLSALDHVNGSIPNADLADMVQATIKGRASAAGTGVPVDLTAAQVRAIAAYTASLINITDASGYYASTTVENALAEVWTYVSDTEASLIATDGNVTAHITDTTDAHLATAIGYAGSTNLAASTVEVALDTLAARIATKITVAGTAPGSPAVNDLWVDTT